MNQNYDKPALTLTEQVDRLASRGMDVGDPADAQRLLSRISYYRLSAYWHPFRIRSHGDVKDTFIPNTHINHIISLYEFDRELRILLGGALERLEVTIRTRITYQIAQHGGAFAHTNPNCFREGFRYYSELNAIAKRVNDSDAVFLTHYKKKYKGHPEIVPIWMATEVMTFGMLSKFYGGLIGDIQKPVCMGFGIEQPKKFSEWLGVCSNLRNVCAHHDRLWNRQLKPTFQSQGVGFHSVSPDRLFYAVLAVRYLLHIIGEESHLASDLMRIFENLLKHEDIGYSHAMGMPEDWTGRLSQPPEIPQ